MRHTANLSECDDLVRAATCAEMIYKLCEGAVSRGMEGEEFQEYVVFAGAAVNAIVAELPEYIRPFNAGVGVLHLAERCQSVNGLACVIGGIDNELGGGDYGVCSEPASATVRACKRHVEPRGGGKYDY